MLYMFTTKVSCRKSLLWLEACCNCDPYGANDSSPETKCVLALHEWPQCLYKLCLGSSSCCQVYPNRNDLVWLAEHFHLVMLGILIKYMCLTGKIKVKLSIKQAKQTKLYWEAYLKVRKSSYYKVKSFEKSFSVCIGECDQFCLIK